MPDDGLKNWCKLDIDSDNLDSYTNKHDDWNLMFAHHEEEEEVYPLTLTEIADAQHKDWELKAYFKKKCRKPPINIPYKRTFGTPDQGQRLDMWES